MLESIFITYVIINVVALILMGITLPDIYESIQDNGLKVKHLVTFVLLPFTVVALFVFVLLISAITKFEDFLDGSFMNKTIWKNK